jgi:probable rRNA maturation factor
VRRWVRAACAIPAEVTVRFVADDEGRSLNRDFRGKDYATNVLSFPYASGATLSGDLVLCLPVLEREAREQGKSAEAHCAHLIVHGMLHLQGHDHETGRADAERMEALEREILADLGYPDPYA